jgi:hypothetical protein
MPSRPNCHAYFRMNSGDLKANFARLGLFELRAGKRHCSTARRLASELGSPPGRLPRSDSAGYGNTRSQAYFARAAVCTPLPDSPRATARAACPSQAWPFYLPAPARNISLNNRASRDGYRLSYMACPFSGHTTGTAHRRIEPSRCIGWNSGSPTGPARGIRLDSRWTCRNLRSCRAAPPHYRLQCV